MKIVIYGFLFAFLMLGLMTSATLDNARAQGWSLKVALWTTFAHLVLAGGAVILAGASKPVADGYRVGLSPVAWLFGSFASYLTGFVGFWLLK